MGMMSRFRDDERGNIAIMAGFLMIPLIGFVGLAVDLARAYAVQSQVQQALDAAALAGGRTFYVDTTERNARIQAFFSENLKSTRFGATVSPVTISANTTAGTLTVSASATLPTVLMRVLGQNIVNVASSAQITRGDSTLEIVLALDVSGSMDGWDSLYGGTKIAALRNAASLFMDTVYPNGVDDKISTGIVSWDHMTHPASVLVNPTAFLIPSSAVKTEKGPEVDTGGGEKCQSPSGSMTPYRYSHEYYAWMGGYKIPDVSTGLATSDGDVTGLLKPYIEELTEYYNSAYTLVCVEVVDPKQNDITHHSMTMPTLALPLRTDPAVLKSYISKLVSNGWTGSPVGVFWGWRMLSPTWKGQWQGVPSDQPRAYNDTTNYKAIILMTDGENNTLFLNNSTAGTTITNNIGKAQCDAMKASGIRVYTVGFALTSAAAINYMTYCASPGYYFPAASGTELVAIFKAIASDLASLRLSR